MHQVRGRRLDRLSFADAAGQALVDDLVLGFEHLAGRQTIHPVEEHPERVVFHVPCAGHGVLLHGLHVDMGEVNGGSELVRAVGGPGVRVEHRAMLEQTDGYRITHRNYPQ